MSDFQSDSSSTINPYEEILKNRRLIEALEKKVGVFEKRHVDNALYSLLKYLKVVCILLPLFFLIFLGIYLFINDKPASSQVIIGMGAVVVVINFVEFLLKNFKK